MELLEERKVFSTTVIKIYFLCEKFLRTKYEVLQLQ